MTDFPGLLSHLGRSGVRFILVGGTAAIGHGAARLTQDVDIVYERSEDNLRLLEATLAPLSPYLRGAPLGLPFKLTASTLRNGLNFTLTTTMGDLDLLGEITAGGGYEDLLSHTVELHVFNTTLQCLDLPTLIAVKRACGRPKDFEALAELEALRREIEG